MQVAFAPDDSATFGTQSMTMPITVDTAPLTVVADHQSKVYGSPDPLLSYSANGFQAGDTAATALSGALAAALGSDVGSHAITIGTLTTTANYTLAFTGNTLDITAAPLTITAGSDAKVYGATFSPTAFTSNGLLNGDTVNAVTLATAGSAAGAAVGAYDIVPSAAVGAGLANYAIVYANGSLSVTPATLSVTADAQTKVEGTADPALTFSAGGFQAGDTAAGVLSGSLARAAGEAPGSYAITRGSLASNANYAIAFTGNALAITAAPTPPPSAPFSIAPIPPQFNTDGDEVELRVVVLRSAGAEGRHESREAEGRRHDEDDRNGRRGTFSVSGLTGLRIDNEGGEIHGHIDADVSAVTVFTVTVTFTENGVTATQQITWTVKPASSHKRRDR